MDVDEVIVTNICVGSVIAYLFLNLNINPLWATIPLGIALYFINLKFVPASKVMKNVEYRQPQEFYQQNQFQINPDTGDFFPKQQINYPQYPANKGRLI